MILETAQECDAGNKREGGARISDPGKAGINHQQKGEIARGH